jgi:ABC-type multidrug transport system fused ATPase/permease subunit
MPKNKDKIYKNAFIYLKELIKPHKIWYFIASILALVSVGTGLFSAKVTQWLVDSATTGNMRAVYGNASLFALIIAANLVIAYTSSISVTRLASGAVRDMKRHIAQSLVNADYRTIIRHKTGDMLSTVNSDTQAVTAFLSGDLIGLFSQAVMALGAIIYLLCTNPLLTFVTFAYTPLGMFFTLTLNKKMQKLYLLRADKAGKALSVIEQALMQIPVIKSFLMEKQMRLKVQSSCRAVLETDMKIAGYDAPLQTACSSTAQIPRLVFMVFAGLLVMRGRMTLGAFVALYDLLAFIIGPSVYFPFMLNSLNRAIASIARVKRLEEMPPAPADNPAVRSKLHFQPEIKIQNLSFRYESKNILSNLSFTYNGTGIVALKGKSGSGKTTLLDLIAGLLIPSDGSIRLSGAVSAMPQDSFLFDGTISENVRLGNLNASIADVAGSLKRAGAEGLDGEMIGGEGGGRLSGGQRQRVSLARTILSDAPIWLLDEPTAALDADTERIILDMLGAERTKRLIIISAHRQSLFNIADAVLDLDAEGGVTA